MSFYRKKGKKKSLKRGSVESIEESTAILVTLEIISLNRDGNGAGMGRATPTPFLSRLYIFFLIPVPNLGWGELVSPMPVYKKVDNPILVSNVFSGIMLLENTGL